MIKNFKKMNFSERSECLFQKVMFKIHREKMKKEKRIILFSFLVLIASILLAPFSYHFFVSQIKTSGIFYIIFTGFENPSILLSFWKEFVLAVMEYFPLFAVFLFVFHLAVFIFVFHLLIAKKDFIFKKKGGLLFN